MDPTPPPPPTPPSAPVVPPGDRSQSARRPSFGPTFFLGLFLGLALVGYGGWMMYNSGWHSPTGFLIACVGVMIVPIGIARLLGGLGAMGLAVWLIIHAAGSFDYVYGALILFVGGSSAVDGWKTLRGK